MFRKSSLLYWSLALTIVLWAFHLAANTFYFYWTYWWYDWMMHFLAGLAGGLTTYWVLLHSGLWRRKSDRILLPVLVVFVCLMIVGITWEVFEYTNGITDFHEEVYTLDVIHDLMMDALGAITAVIIGMKRTFLKQNSSNTSL
ncbi:MAG: hypothetical protein Q7R67_00010 [bacterium]|nr:hypothetical protein [bacterium]